MLYRGFRHSFSVKWAALASATHMTYNAIVVWMAGTWVSELRFLLL